MIRLKGGEKPVQFELTKYPQNRKPRNTEKPKINDSVAATQRMM